MDKAGKPEKLEVPDDDAKLRQLLVLQGSGKISSKKNVIIS